MNGKGFSAYIYKESAMRHSTVFLITLHGPYGHDRGDAQQGCHLMGDGLQAAAPDEDGAYGIGKIVHGVDIGGQVSPVGHGAYRGEES